MLIAVFGLEQAEPVARDLHHVGQVAVDARDFLFHAEDGLVRLVFVELQDARHLDVHQPQYVVFGDFAYHLRIIRREAFVDVCAGSVHVFGLFERLVLVDALLDEYLFERGEVQAFLQFPLFDEEFAADELERVVHRSFQHFAYREEARFLVVDDAAVG